MNPEVFAEWLRRQGHRVVRTQSSYWFDQGPRVFQAFPYHWVIEPEEQELTEFLIAQKAIALRYSTPLDAPEGCVSYHTICARPHYDLSDVGPKSRSQVRHGLRVCKVGPISFDEFAAEGFRMLQDTMKRQGGRSRMSKEQWERMASAASTLDGFEVWGASVGDQMGACIMFVRVDDCISILFQQSDSNFLAHRVNNALTFVLTQNLVLRPQVRTINYGLHSLDALPGVDQFKINMGYTVKPLRQRVVFHPWIPDGALRLLHSLLPVLRAVDPRNSTFAKVGGLVRFHLAGRKPLSQQEFPEALEASQKGLLDACSVPAIHSSR